jgi:hypothetical protein
MPYNTKEAAQAAALPHVVLIPPADWIWGLCPGPMPVAATVPVRDADCIGDVVGLGRELLLTCRCTRQRVVCLAALTLVPGLEARVTVGALRKRLRCVACGTAGTEGRVELRDWRTRLPTGRTEA